jgi:hypothetical protein
MQVAILNGSLMQGLKLTIVVNEFLGTPHTDRKVRRDGAALGLGNGHNCVT